MKEVGIVGAGIMGASIAVAVASSGFVVRLKEMDAEALMRGVENIDKLLARLVSKGLPENEAKQRRKLIQPVESFNDFRTVTLAIEAVVENIEIKGKVFQELDRHCPNGCILATNTSSLSVTQIASFTGRPCDVVGIHFFNPAHIMKLIEVVPGIWTSQSTVDAAIEFGTEIGKLAIRVEECPSFLVNRLLTQYLNEALWMVQEKKDSAEAIDKAACDLLMPMGPLSLRDMNGLDTGLAVARFNFQEYGERFRPPALLEKMVEAKMFGRKSGAGFYLYDQKTAKATAVNPEFLTLLDSMNDHATGDLNENDKRRLFLPMINEAFIALQEKICEPSDLDPALKAALGMRQGPLEYAFQIGLPECLSELERLFDSWGERFRPAPLLKRYVWAGKTSLC